MAAAIVNPQKRLSDLLNDGLFRDSSILIVATVIAGGLNYLYQIAMGRLLGPEQYGVFGALFGLFYAIGILSRGTNYCSTRYVSKLSGDERGSFLHGFAIRAAGFGAFLFVVLALATPFLVSFLKISGPLLLLVVLAGALIGLIKSVHTGAIRGLQQFEWLAGFQISTALAKFVLGVGLVLLGYGVFGAVVAPLLAGVLVLAAMTYYLRNFLRDGNGFTEYGQVYRYAVPAVLAGFCLTIPANVDVMLVKHLFTSTAAGLYTSVTVFGKIMIFLPASVSGAMFPKVAENESDQKETDHLLWKALLYTGVMAFGAALVYAAFPELLLGLMFGGAYAEAAALLPWYGLMIGVFSLAVVLVNYSLARHDTGFVKVFAGLTLLEIGLIYGFGSSMLRIVQLMLAVNTAALLTGLFMVGSWEVIPGA